MPSKGSSPSLKRRTWGVRIALWSALLVAAVVAIVVFLLQGGGDSGTGPSRFDAIHTFDTADYHSLAFSPAADDAILFGHHGGVQKSNDDGDSWTEVIDEAGRDAMNLVYDTFTPTTVYMAGHDVYYRSEDGGETWAAVDSNLPGLDLHTFAASPTMKGRLYAVPVGFGLQVSDDGGRDWRLVSSDVPPGTAAIQELPDGTLLLAAVDAGILRSGDGGKTWAASRQGIDTGVVFTIRAAPEGRRVYAGTSSGLFVSTDGGTTWNATALNDTLVLVIGMNPSDPLEVLVVNGEGRLYRSSDGGQTWS